MSKSLMIVLGLAMAAGCSTPTRTVTAREFSDLHAQERTDQDCYVYQGTRDGYHYMDHYTQRRIGGMKKTERVRTSADGLPPQFPQEQATATGKTKSRY